MNFETLSAAIDSLQPVLDSERVELVLGTVNTPFEDHWTTALSQPMVYDEVRSMNFEILTRKGRPSRAWFHVVITRLDNGLYEVVSYVL